MAGRDALREIRTRWRLLAGCVLGLAVGVHSLPFYTAGLFIGPLTHDFGWTRAEASLAPTLLIATLGLSAPGAGAVIDRLGERPVATACLVAVALGFFALSLQGGWLPGFLIIFCLMALLGSGSSTLVFSRLIVGNFALGRGTALGIGMIGTGLASMLAPLLLGPLIAGFGWRSGYLALGCVVLGAAPLVWLATGGTARVRAVESEAFDGVSVRQAVRDPIFWKLAACFLLVALASPGLVVHFVPMLTDRGVPAASAARLASLIGVFLIAGRLSTGILFDLVFAPRAAAVLMLASAACLAALAIGGPGLAILGAVGIGLSFGAEIDLVGYLCGRYFGMRAFGRLYGLLYAAVLAGTSLSPLLYGALRDRFGGYDAAILLSAGALASSAAIFLTMRRFDGGAPAPR